MKVDRNNHYDNLTESYERHFKRKDKRKKTNMKVSGGSVKKLRNIISKT